MGDRLMVGLQILDLPIGVQIPVSQQIDTHRHLNFSKKPIIHLEQLSKTSENLLYT